MKKTAVLVALTLAMTLGPIAAHAATITINATDSGWYNPSSGHSSANDNYAAGPNDTYRNFFVFDLSGLSGVVTSATLRLDTDPNWVQGTPNYEIYDVTTPVATLVTTHSAGAAANAIHADLGSGVFYGSGTVTNAPMLFDFTLNSSARTSITAASGGLWALGGRNSLLDNSFAFWNTGSTIRPYIRQLIVETDSVPEPATLLLLGIGLTAAGMRRRMNKRG